jgi:hypothetical protein
MITPSPRPELQHVGDPAAGDPVALRDRQQVGPGAAPWMQGARVQQRADFVKGADYPLVGAAFDERGAGCWRVQAEDDLHRGGLAGAVGA